MFTCLTLVSKAEDDVEPQHFFNSSHFPTDLQLVSSLFHVRLSFSSLKQSSDGCVFLSFKGGVGKFEKPARDTLFVIFHGMLLTSR